MRQGDIEFRKNPHNNMMRLLLSNERMFELLYPGVPIPKQDKYGIVIEVDVKDVPDLLARLDEGVRRTPRRSALLP